MSLAPPSSVISIQKMEIAYPRGGLELASCIQIYIAIVRKKMDVITVCQVECLNLDLGSVIACNMVLQLLVVCDDRLIIRFSNFYYCVLV